MKQLKYMKSVGYPMEIVYQCSSNTAERAMFYHLKTKLSYFEEIKDNNNVSVMLVGTFDAIE